MARSEERYFTCPIYLLGDLLNDKETTLKNCLHFGLYSYVEKLIDNYREKGESYVTKSEISKQVLYCVYREELPPIIKSYLNRKKVEYIGQDHDYNGFSGKNFEPEEIEIEELETLFSKDNHFFFECLKYIAYRKAYNQFFVKRSFVIDYSLIGQNVKVNMPEKSATFDISVSLLLDFKYQEKSEFELEQLICFLALRSILGKSLYQKSNWEFLLARMLGYTKQAEMPTELKPKEKAFIEKYSNRYQRTKMFKAMADNWHIYFYNGTNKRGFVFGLDKDSEKIFEANYKNSNEYKQVKRKSEQEAIKKRMLDDLKKGSLNDVNALPF